MNDLMEVDVSVIIVNYKTVGLIIDAIESIFNKTEGITFEIIVVDNHSGDDSGRILQDCFGGRVTYLSLSENIGFGRANNAGVVIASGRNIFFLNPDTLLINNAIHLLSNFLDNHPECGIVGGNLYNDKLQPTNSHNKRLPSIFDEVDQAFGRMLSRLVYGKNTLFNYTNIPIEVGFICGADLMIAKRVIDEVGCFCPDFFMYYEETELAYRVGKAGYKIMNVPSASIIHLEGKSFTQSENREYRSLLSRKIYFAKVYSRGYIFVADKLYLLLTFVALVISSLLGLKNYKKKLQQRYRLILKVQKEHYAR